MSTSPPSPPPAGGTPAAFTITRQDHSDVYDPNDPDASTWTIYFKTPDGTESYVKVPSAEYNAQNVGALIAQHAAEIAAVANLGRPAK